MCSSNDDGDDSDEFDLDMTFSDEVRERTEAEYLGTYASMEDFYRSQIEPLLIPEGLWLLECVDLERVREMLESGIYRYWRDDDGRVFRERIAGTPAGR